MAANTALEVFGITLVGATPENGKKLLLTIALAGVVLLFSAVVRRLLARSPGDRLGSGKVRFWSRQAIGVAAGAILVLGIVSIWFDDPARLTTGLGLVTAGVAFALQRVITAVAGHSSISPPLASTTCCSVTCCRTGKRMICAASSSTPWP